MVFASPLFLFQVLSVVLVLHFVWSGLRYRNGFLLVTSILFYTWGEVGYVLVLLASITLNYLLGLCVEWAETPRRRHALVALAVAANLALLGYFKYANFFVDSLNALSSWLGAGTLTLAPVHLPLGISFFTFHALSYVLDVGRGEVRATRNFLDFALYISFFPQAIAGPIVRYHEVAGQLTDRRVTLDGFAAGIVKFILGLSKKVLVANTVGAVADPIFSLPAHHLTCGLTWLGIVCYSLQIYFDFSGYSDMAIGLARMFGFEFPENFNYPYISRTVTEFWRRWHISLSTWYRDYLYIPLGGNRRGSARTFANLVIVFFLCGLWHGASWTFVFWGAYHGAFLVLERLGLARGLDRLWRPLQHAVVLVIIMVGWVFFRASSFPHALEYLRAMAGFGEGGGTVFNVSMYLSTGTILALVAGAAGSIPLFPWLREWTSGVRSRMGRRPLLGWASELLFEAVPLTVLGLLLLGSLLQLAGGTHNPFIYYRF